MAGAPSAIDFSSVSSQQITEHAPRLQVATLRAALDKLRQHVTQVG